jgi:UDP-2,4-diacetamido-2,4,6-trideoxy-beta-L-altropyranose hydrolase
MNRACSVVFRVDESVRMGWGHMSRCRALAEALTEAGAEVSFWCRDIRAESRLTLQRCGIRVIDLPDEKAFLCREWSGDIVVVDGYHFGEDFWHCLLTAHPRQTVCIDDLRDIQYVADLVICYNEGISADQFRLAPNTRLLLGGRYLLLRPEILTAARLTDRSVPRQGVLLAAGGTRQDQWAKDMLAHMTIVEPLATVTVLSGRRLSRNKVLRQAGIFQSRVRFFSNLEAVGMLRLYRRACYLVAPASTMMLEAFSVGCPLISGWVAENQRNSLNFYEREGLIINVGDLRQLTTSKLQRAISRAQFRAGQMIRLQRAYFVASRLGLEEVVRAILMSDNEITSKNLDSGYMLGFMPNS